MSQPIRLDFPRPHSEGQREIFEYYGYGVVFAGRRWGKTEVGVIRLVHDVLTKPGLYWWVGLSWKSASMKRAWRLLSSYTRQVWQGMGQNPGERIREVAHELRWPSGGEIWLRTAENPDSLAGEGVRGAILDEFSLMDERIWHEYVQATLLDYGGWALFLGVPKGENWAAKLWRMAQTRPGWRAWHFTSYDNPYLDRSLLDAIRATTPAALFAQEYLAEITEDSSPFHNLEECATSVALLQGEPGGRYVAGVDWGKLNDFTVISVLDADACAQVYLKRVNQLDYDLQLELLWDVQERFQPTWIAESNAMGEALIDQLRADGLRVRGVAMTPAAKTQMIDQLLLAFEKQEIAILPDEVQLNELRAFERVRLPSGVFRYSAPQGMHDDTVIALALAYSGIGRYLPDNQPGVRRPRGRGAVDLVRVGDSLRFTAREEESDALRVPHFV